MMAVDILNLSDEELLAMDPSTLLGDPESDSSQQETSAEAGEGPETESQGAADQVSEAVTGAESAQVTDEEDEDQGTVEATETNTPAAQAEGKVVEGAS
jgi:hypothetical protein